MPTHKAYVQATAGEKPVVKSVETPVPTSGQVLIKVLATPILNYTAKVLDGSLGFPLAHPLTPGISAIGRIVSTGPDATYVSKDQLVFINPSIIPRDNAEAGVVVLHGWFGGVTPQSNALMANGWRNGSWAEMMLAPLENVLPLNENRLTRELGYTIADLCWINEFLVPFGGWLAAGLVPGQTAIVAPASGHFGSCAVRIALAMGARTVIAAGRKKAGLDQVANLDETGRVRPIVFTGKVDEDAASLRAATPNGGGADLYLDFSPFEAGGSTHPKACVAALRRGGYAILMGGVREDISLNYAVLMNNNITVRGNFMYSPDAPRKLRELLEGGILNLKGLKSTVFGFEDLDNAITYSGSHGDRLELTVFTPAQE